MGDQVKTLPLRRIVNKVSNELGALVNIVEMGIGDHSGLNKQIFTFNSFLFLLQHLYESADELFDAALVFWSETERPEMGEVKFDLSEHIVGAP